MLRHFRVRRRDGRTIAPSRSAIRDVLVRVNPRQLDAALGAWNAAHGGDDSALAIDGKTMRGAGDRVQAHVLGIVGHDTLSHYGQKKSA